MFGTVCFVIFFFRLRWLYTADRTVARMRTFFKIITRFEQKFVVKRYFPLTLRLIFGSNTSLCSSYCGSSKSGRVSGWIT